MSELERIVDMTAAYDCRDPEPSKNYGVHGVELRMVLKGPLGATQFVLFTGWLLPETVGLPVAERERPLSSLAGLDYGRALAAFGPAGLIGPMPADLGYHSPTPIYDGQEPMGGEPCPYLDGKPCFYDGSGLNAYRVFERLLREGSDGVWTELEEYYRLLFEPVAESAV